jgi:DNA-binding transcriptional LysR family regulator
MDLRQLRSFAAVAQAGTYAAAAEVQSMSQPAVWRQVRELELELGLALFERYGRRVRPTGDGRRLLEQAEVVLATVERFAATASDLRSVRAGVVAIACASPHLQRFLAAGIGEFRRAHPEVAFVIREYGGIASPGRGLREDLLDGVVDVATLVGSSDDPEVDGFDVYAVRLVLAVPDDHPWRHEPTIEVAKLSDQPLILSPVGAFSREAIEGACRRAGFEPEVAFALASPTSQIAIGLAGLGLPVAVDDMVEGTDHRPWPVITERGRPIGDTVRLVWRAGAKLSPSVQAFVDVIRSGLRPAPRAPSRARRRARSEAVGRPIAGSRASSRGGRR